MAYTEEADSTDFDELVVIDWDAAMEQVSSVLVISHFSKPNVGFIGGGIDGSVRMSMTKNP